LIGITKGGGRRMLAAGRALPPATRGVLLWFGALGLLALALRGADALLYRATLPITVTATNGEAALLVGSERLALGNVGQPDLIVFEARDPVQHEYQIDGSDSTNNFTQDPAYLHAVARTPYYALQAWMRDLDGLSVWRDAVVRVDDRQVLRVPAPALASTVAIPAGARVSFRAEWQRPETPVALDVLTTTHALIHVTLDRNRRSAHVTISNGAGPGSDTNLDVFFPVDVTPFAAMVADLLVRTALWAILLLLVVLLADGALGAVRWALAGVGDAAAVRGRRPSREQAPLDVSRGPSTNPLVGWSAGAWGAANRQWRALTTAIAPVGVLALLASFAYVCWIALAQFQALPHVHDASAYYFGAKIFASDRLYAPAPAAPRLFPGPFMVATDGRWFPQYPPMTSLCLAVGLRLGVPWLVEPVMGTLALLAIGLVAARLYDRRVATLAVLLGALSPFYSYLAASYLSHAVALCFLTWGLWALVRFAQGGRDRNLLVAGALFGAATLTRDLVGLLVVVLMVLAVLALHARGLRHDWRRWVLPGAQFIGVLSVFGALWLVLNLALTGDALVSPRTLFSPGDHWGFGPDIGFYGGHTLAAGFVTLDELLTALAIDLYGWPFMLTLAVLLAPFLLWRARLADWLLLGVAAVTTGSFIGYFYHGIYLGPRYLYETLPFLLMLTARGVVELERAGGRAARAVMERLEAWRGRTAAAEPRGTVSGAGAWLALVALIGCNLLYYTPRQIALYHDFNGLPVGQRLDLRALQHPPIHHAIVVTGDYPLYGYALFPLNDPLLRGDVLYAFASTEADYADLRGAYPGRAIYRISIAADGAPSYLTVAPQLLSLPIGGVGGAVQRSLEVLAARRI
jgi:4-amino-4-deoxy-L-arabinose transferase-like glycosyltransferase